MPPPTLVAPNPATAEHWAATYNAWRATTDAILSLPSSASGK
jgi:hypothetical protein